MSAVALSAWIPAGNPLYAAANAKQGKASVKAQLDLDQPAALPSDAQLLSEAKAIFGTLPDKMPGSEADTPARIELGKRLYFEKAISINRTQSCNSCHPVDNKGAGADHEVTGLGAEGKHGERNDPPTFNAGFQIAQFWDGRAATLEGQAKGPILNPIEMGMPNEAAVLQRLQEIAAYGPLFEKAFPDSKPAMSYDNLAKAIAAFERTLISRARFDKFLAGDASALSQREKHGLKVFMDVGCIQCHSGPNLGGTMYQKMGVFHPYANTHDIGRAKETQEEADKFVFKVPMLRNTLLTAPYFHDGAVATVAEAVDQMGHLQLNKKLSHEEINAILHFFVSLSDEKLTSAATKIDAQPAPWRHPLLSDLAKASKEVQYGHRLLHETNTLPEMKKYTGNALTCMHCHQEEGTKPFSLPWVGVSQSYPQYRARENKVGTLEERINGCFTRSLNGHKLPEKSKEMKAMVAYMDWLSAAAVKNQPGLGTPRFDPPNRKADVDRGKQVYARFCQSCHGQDGQGYRAMLDKNEPNVVPALWGNNSYNDGAGMHRLLTAASFIHGSMPLGVSWNNPTLDANDAYDVAAYINAQPRPKMAGLEKDYPDLSKKPVDAPYPPFADKFPAEQHKFGPFQPMQDAKAK